MHENAGRKIFAAAQESALKKHSDDALVALQTLTREASQGYAMLARFRTAALMGEKGDTLAAAKIFASLANDDSIDQDAQFAKHDLRWA